MVSRKIISTVALVLFVAVICLVSSQTCTIGRNDESEQVVRTDQRFYLDVNNPATCNGTITNWRVCYYGRSDSGLNSYWATYAIYRRMGSGADESYVKVSELFRAVRTTIGFGDGADGRNREGFNCYTDSIDAGNSPLTIQAGDIIGACVFDPQDEDIFDRAQLNIVGEVPAGLGESLMRVDVGDGPFEVDCTMDDIPSSIQQGDLREQNNRRLHIYANIEPAPEPVPATAPVTTTDIQSVTTQEDNQEIDQESSNRGSLIAIMAGSTSGVLILSLCIIILMVVLSVVLYLKRRQKAINLTSNIAYACQCKSEDIDYYSISQPSPETDLENKNDEYLIIKVNDTAEDQSTEDQPLTAIHDTISESQPTISHVPETNEEVVHTIIEHHTENGCSLDQPSSVLYDTIYDTIEETQITEVLQSGATGVSSPAVLISAKEVSHKEPDLSTMVENVAYRSSYSSPINLEAQTPYEERVNLEQNVAYKSTKVILSPNVAYESHNNLKAQTPCEGVCLEQNVAYYPESTKVVLSPNVAYESHDHMHQGAESQEEYEYI